jgi:GntR family transcriptional regulator
MAAISTESLKRIARTIANANSASSDDAGATGKARSGPLYLTLYAAILSEIEAGHWVPGSKLPSDTSFARSLPLSLGTIQKALQRLAHDGVIARHYRRGTFVRGLAVDVAEIRNLRFLAEDGVSLLPVYVRVLDVGLVDRERPWSAAFGQEARFVRIRRVCSVNLEFRIFLETFLPARRFRALLKIPPAELDGTPLTHFLGSRFSAPTIRTVQRVRAGRLNDEVCEMLGTAAGSSGLHWEMHGYSHKDEAIIYQRAQAPSTDAWLEIRSREG